MKELTMEERFAALESVKIKGLKHEGKYLYLKCETMVDKCIVIGTDQLLFFIQEERTRAKAEVVRDILKLVDAQRLPQGDNFVSIETLKAYAKQNNL